MAALKFQPPALAPPFAHMLASLTRAGLGVWVVGGWVRDQLRGVAAHDADFCTNAGAEAIEGAARAAGVVVLLDQVAAMHGTYRLAADGEVMDLARLREDVQRVGARHAQVRFTQDLASDLARRDLTINALALPYPLPPDPQAALIDLHGGRRDLQARVLRLIGVPEQRLEEDPLRLLRVARFATLEPAWQVEDATAAAMLRCAPLVGTVSSERRLAELQRALASALPARFWQLAEASGAWASLLPADVDRASRERATAALAAVAPHLADPSLRWASFVLAGVQRGSSSVAHWLAPLRFSRAWQQRCATVVEASVPPGAALEDADVARWALALGTARLAELTAWAAPARRAPPLAEIAEATYTTLARADTIRAGRALWRPQQLQLDAPALFAALQLPEGSVRGALLQKLLVHVWLHPQDDAPERLRSVAQNLLSTA